MRHAITHFFQLIEFDDVKNDGSFSSSSRSVRYPCVGFDWARTVWENTTDRVAINFLGENFTDPSEAGRRVTKGTINITVRQIRNLSKEFSSTCFCYQHRVYLSVEFLISLQLSAYAYEGYGIWLPHLTHTEATNQFDVQIDGIETNSGFNHSRCVSVELNEKTFERDNFFNDRFALEFVVVSDAENATSSAERQSTRTLDDEHTPGIFTVGQLFRSLALFSWMQAIFVLTSA